MDRRFTNFDIRVIISAEIQRVLIDQENKRIDIILTEKTLIKQLAEEGKMLDLHQN